MRSIDVRVTGRVQGVFFRAATQERARRLGVRGTVRNEPDGSVEIEAEGEDDAVEAFVVWLHDGPTHAKVDSVVAREREPRNFTGFRVTG